EQAIKDAAAELKLPKTSWDVERLATLNVMLKVARHKWSTGQGSKDAGEMIALMDAITTLRKERGINDDHPTGIEVSIVHPFHGVVTCHACGAKIEVSDQPFPGAVKVDPANAVGADSTPEPELTGERLNEPEEHPSDHPKPPANVVPMMKVTHREGVSAS